MALAQAIKTEQNAYTVENAMNALLSKLDEALDDVEQGRVKDIFYSSQYHGHSIQRI